MGLSFGWQKNDQRESIWLDDDALVDVPEAARLAWEEDGGDAKHLRPYAKNGAPARITYQVLDGRGKRIVEGEMAAANTPTEAVRRACRAAFRIGFDMPDAPARIRCADSSCAECQAGAGHPRVVKEGGIAVVASEFADSLELQYPDIVDFYGWLIWQGSVASSAEKKALLLRSMQRRSARSTAPASSPTSAPGPSQAPAPDAQPQPESTTTGPAPTSG